MEESPYTKVPNSILDFEGLDVYEFRILILILRKTIGFNKKSDGISLSQFIKFTGISKDKVIKSLENLQKNKFISVQKQTLKNGGKSFNRYTPLVLDKDYLVRQKDKGSTSERLGLVCEKDIQKKIEQKKIDKRREREGYIFFSLSEKEQLKEIDSYIQNLIYESEYIKNQKGFELKIRKQLSKGDEEQLKDFEKWYLSKTCEELENKYSGKYLDGYLIDSIYPYFNSKMYDPSNKFTMWLIDTKTKEGYSENFEDRNELYKTLKRVTDGII
ncbi:replication protein [Arcobacter sp. s6]|uniref:replication protein n=1 Tax=Arcobacter sp. s6 TaxID=3230363 RepID=UPI0034A09798